MKQRQREEISRMAECSSGDVQGADCSKISRRAANVCNTFSTADIERYYS